MIYSKRNLCGYVFLISPLIFFTSKTMAQSASKNYGIVPVFDFSQHTNPIPYERDLINLKRAKSAKATRTHFSALPIQVFSTGEIDPSSLLFQSLKLSLEGRKEPSVHSVVFAPPNGGDPIAGVLELNDDSRHGIFRAFLNGLVLKSEIPGTADFEKDLARKATQIYLDALLGASMATVETTLAGLKKLGQELEPSFEKFSNPSRLKKNYSRIVVELRRLLILREICRRLDRTREENLSLLAETEEAMAAGLRNLFLSIFKLDHSFVRTMRATSSLTQEARVQMKLQIAQAVSTAFQIMETEDDKGHLAAALNRLAPHLNPTSPFGKLKYWKWPPNWWDALLRVSFRDRMVRAENEGMKFLIRELIRSHAIVEGACQLDLE